MNRRSFLGSVIGTLLSAKLPFFARAWNEPLQYEKELKSIPDYKMLFQDSKADIIVQVLKISLRKSQDILSLTVLNWM